MPPSGAVSSMAEAATSAVSGRASQSLARGPQVGFPVAQVAAQRHVDSLAPACPAQTSTAK